MAASRVLYFSAVFLVLLSLGLCKSLPGNDTDSAAAGNADDTNAEKKGEVLSLTH